MTAADHRSAITEALQPDLPMYVMRRDTGRGLQLFVGLWGVWATANDTDPNGLKVVFATVTTTGHGGDGPVPLGSLPWTVLQLQAILPSEPVWAEVSAALRSEIAALQPNGPDGPNGCDRTLVYNSNQKLHNVRQPKDPDFLAGYTIERVEPGSSDSSEVRPLQSLYRTRVEYKVFRGRETDLHPEPALRVYLERRMPKHQHTSHKLHSETGLERRGDLFAAIQTWRTWVVLHDEDAG